MSRPTDHCKPVLLSGGSRRAGPMSPAEFANEPLAAMIRSHGHIKGIRIGREEHLISPYTDDILLYLHDHFNFIPFILSLFEKYGKLSGYKVN